MSTSINSNLVIPAQAGIQRLYLTCIWVLSTALRWSLFIELDSGLRRMTSDLPACGLSRMASCSINDGFFEVQL